MLTLGATGLACKKSIDESESAREFAFADLKATLIDPQLGGGFRWLPEAPGWLAGATAATISLERGGSSSPASSAATLGIAGQLARRVADQLKLCQDFFVANWSLRRCLAESKLRAGAEIRADPAIPCRGTRFFAYAFRRDFVRASRPNDSCPTDSRIAKR